MTTSRGRQAVVGPCFEARYLDGHDALFPELSTRFDGQLRTSQEVAASAMRAAELDGVEPAPAEDQAASRARAAELVADLVEPAKAEALDKLGEGRRAFDIATGWVRARLAHAAESLPEVPSP